MFDRNGQFAATSVRELRRIVSRVKSDDPAFMMPPPKQGALTPAQRNALIEHALADVKRQESH